MSNEVGKKMEEKINSLEWTVLTWSFNDDRCEEYNIFDNRNVDKFIREAINKEYTFRDFLFELDGVLQNAFWCKCEYEVMVGGLFTRDSSRYEKIDAYTQLKPNLKQLAAYIYDTLGLNRDEN